MASDIILPYNFEPRLYQMPAWMSLEEGVKRAVLVWHRRAGKDLLCLNWTITQAMERPGLYWHVLPTYNQGRKIVWDGMNRDGRPFLDYFPRDLIRRHNNTDMQLELEGGSMFQVVGSDHYDRLVGANPVGCVLSEYALQDPRAWDLIRPILLENGGWAIFDYTPRGKNHGWRLYQMALRMMAEKKGWYAQLLTIKDTGVVSEEDIQLEREAGMSEELIQQEFYCSFEAGIPGAYFMLQLNKARNEGRIAQVPWYPEIPVDTWWDLGIDDSMTVWFSQSTGANIHLIDYYENSGEGLPHYVKYLKDKSYVYGRHTAPHDIKVRELGSGKSRRTVALSLGIEFDVAKKVAKKEDAIEAGRALFPRCRFDLVKCQRGLECLENYRKEYNEKTGTFSTKPVADWSCHGADSFLTLATSYGGFAMRRSYQNNPYRSTRAADSVAGY
jgi:phage terminase large subunit